MLRKYPIPPQTSPWTYNFYPSITRGYECEISCELGKEQYTYEVYKKIHNTFEFRNTYSSEFVLG